MNPPAQLCEQSQRQKDAYRTYYTNPFRLYICSVCTKLFSINSNFSFNQRRNIYIFYLDWPEGIVSIPVGQPDPTRPISLTLTQTPLPQLTIVPCGLILCASLVRFCLNARSSSSRLANPTQRPTRPNPINIANANPNPPTPADRVVPALGHSTVWADFVSVSGSILSQRSCCRVCALCGSEFKIMGLYNRFCNRFFAAVIVRTTAQADSRAQLLPDVFLREPTGRPYKIPGALLKETQGFGWTDVVHAPSSQLIKAFTVIDPSATFFLFCITLPLNANLARQRRL